MATDTGDVKRLSLNDPRARHWVNDREVNGCSGCFEHFSVRKRKHHCRACGRIFCADCSHRRIPLHDIGFKVPVRVCEECYLTRDVAASQSLAEDLDVQDSMVATLKRALHQKVLLLDKVRGFLENMVERVEEVRGIPLDDQTDAATEASNFTDDGFGPLEEIGPQYSNDESLEATMKRCDDKLDKLWAHMAALKESERSQLMVINHLREENDHAKEHMAVLTGMLESTRKQNEAATRRQNQLEADLKIAQARLVELSAIQQAAGSQTSGDQERDPDPQSGSVCEVLRRLCCRWPVWRLMGPLPTPLEVAGTRTPEILGRVQEPIFAASSPVQSSCCHRRPAARRWGNYDHPLLD